MYINTSLPGFCGRILVITLIIATQLSLVRFCKSTGYIHAAFTSSDSAKVQVTFMQLSLVRFCKSTGYIHAAFTSSDSANAQVTFIKQ